ncbi:MAG: amidohydrolase [Tissierellia bacterium]|nr:amidohydrolase [Tissierellia bacterium]
MTILIKNIDYIDIDSEKTIKNSNILVKDGIFSKISKGEIKDLDNENLDIIDGKNMLMMPGLINAHTHMGMCSLRNYADDTSLFDWLSNHIWPAEAKLTDEDIYWSTKLNIAEMFLSGTTCFNDMYYFPKHIYKAVDESKIRGVITRAVLDVGGEGDLRFEEAIDFYKFVQKENNELIKFFMAPHAIYTCTKEYLKLVIDYCKKEDIPIHIHLSETEKEVNDCLKEHNMTPLNYIESLGMLDLHVVAAHCTHLTDEEILKIRDKDFYPVYNVSSNLKLASGFTPIKKMQSNNIQIAMGTDSSSSNNNQNMFEEMHLGSLVNKALNSDPTATKASEIIKMATINGAKALGFDNLGKIEEGYDADFILIDLDKAHLMPRNNDIASIVYSMQGADVDSLCIKGEMVLKNRELLTIDYEKAKFEVNKIINKF